MNTVASWTINLYSKITQDVDFFLAGQENASNVEISIFFYSPICDGKYSCVLCLMQNQTNKQLELLDIQLI